MNNKIYYVVCNKQVWNDGTITWSTDIDSIYSDYNFTSYIKKFNYGRKITSDENNMPFSNENITINFFTTLKAAKEFSKYQQNDFVDKWLSFEG